jgi:hypothetical protein
MISVHPSFPRYTEHDPKVPVYNLTPNVPRLHASFFRYFPR